VRIHADSNPRAQPDIQHVPVRERCTLQRLQYLKQHDAANQQKYDLIVVKEYA
jgi:hypothetical protein